MYILLLSTLSFFQILLSFQILAVPNFVIMSIFPWTPNVVGRLLTTRCMTLSLASHDGLRGSIVGQSMRFVVKRMALGQASLRVLAVVPLHHYPVNFVRWLKRQQRYVPQAQHQVRYQSVQSNPTTRMEINVAVNDKLFINETVTEII